MVIIFALAMLAKKTHRQNAMNQTPQEKQKDILKALSDILSKYGRQAAETVEQLFRLETAHFTSKQWQMANTPGMEIFSQNFPFGWTSLKKFTDKYGISPDKFSKYSIRENGTGIEKTFVVFPDAYTSMMFVADLLDSRGWNGGSWYSTDPVKQENYRKKLNSITPKLVNAL